MRRTVNSTSTILRRVQKRSMHAPRRRRTPNTTYITPGMTRIPRERRHDSLHVNRCRGMGLADSDDEMDAVSSKRGLRVSEDLQGDETTSTRKRRANDSGASMHKRKVDQEFGKINEVCLPRVSSKTEFIVAVGLV